MYDLPLASVTLRGISFGADCPTATDSKIAARNTYELIRRDNVIMGDCIKSQVGKGGLPPLNVRYIQR